MSSSLSVVVGDYPHTQLLKSKSTFAGVPVSFPSISPVHDAFDDMVRYQRYDVCEMAIGAFLQGRQAGKPLLLLPAVMVGGFHHKSIYASPVNTPRTPRDLKGGRVGVRSYSQTTGLWVRGWLAEEYGVAPDSITWITTEGSHAEEYSDPENVVRTDASLVEALRNGDLAAAVLGASAATPELQPLLDDPAAHDRDWYDRHGTVPINHIVVTTYDVAERHDAALRAIYRALCAGIDQTRVAEGPGPLPSAIRYGRATVREAVRLASDYALQQGLISDPPDDIDALFALDAE